MRLWYHRPITKEMWIERHHVDEVALAETHMKVGPCLGCDYPPCEGWAIRLDDHCRAILNRAPDDPRGRELAWLELKNVP